MPDYVEIAQRAAEALAEYGAPAVLKRQIAGDYDATIAEPDDNGAQLYNTVALRGAFKYSEIDGTNVLATDVRLYVSPALATTPQPGDTITFDQVDYMVVNSKPLKPATVVLLHDVQARNA